MDCICFTRTRPQNKVFLKICTKICLVQLLFSAAIFIEIIDNFNAKTDDLTFLNVQSKFMQFN